jgi:hypothetical protein
MAGTITESQLTIRPSSAVKFTVATAEDDPAIRRLLRENPMSGEISVSFEHEPDYFHGVQVAGAEDQTILAFQDGRLVCLGRCSIRDRYINGKIHRIGYLSDLRLDSSVRGRFDIVRRGYQFFRELQHDHPTNFYFTSITSDNFRSIRLLERGLPGMPLYQPLADFVTLLIPVPHNLKKLERLTERTRASLKVRGIEVVSGSNRYVHQLVEFLNSQAGRCHLTAKWDEEKLRSLWQNGLTLSDFQVLIDAGKVKGCAALWDQRSFKQIVIRGYSRRLSFVLPLLNWGASLFGSPRLPAVGSTLAHGFLSPLAVAPEEVQCLPALVELSFLAAASRGLEFLTLGFSANDPRLAIVRKKFGCREYKSRFFQVRWRDQNLEEPVLNNDLIFPEVALL